MKISNNASKGGTTFGGTHESGNDIKMTVIGGEGVRLEGGEGVLSRLTMKDNKKYNFNGKLATPCEIASELNVSNGGRKFDCSNELQQKVDSFGSGGNIVTKQKEGETPVTSINIPKHYQNENFDLQGHKFNITKAYNLIKTGLIKAELLEVNPKDIHSKITYIDENKAKSITNDYNKPIGLIIRINGTRDKHLLIDGNHRTYKAILDNKDKVYYWYIKNANDIAKFYNSDNKVKWYEKGGDINNKNDNNDMENKELSIEIDTKNDNIFENPMFIEEATENDIIPEIEFESEQDNEPQGLNINKYINFYKNGGDITKIETEPSNITIDEIKSELDEQYKIVSDNKALRQQIFEEETKGSGYNEENRGRKRDILINIARAEEKILTLQNLLEVLENKGEVVIITDKQGNRYNNVADFTKINSTNIVFDVDNILVTDKPIFIPILNEQEFARRGFVLDAIRITNDTYIASIKNFNYKDNIENQALVLLTLDQVVLTSDYYITKQKAVNIKVAKERTERNKQQWEGLSDDKKKYYLNQRNQDYVFKKVPAKIKKEKNLTLEKFKELSWQEKYEIVPFYKKYNPAKIKSKLHSNEMWLSFHKMYEMFINPNATMPRYGVANPEVFVYWEVFRDMMKWKMLDIDVDREVTSENYKKAVETSFGDVNTNDILKSEYGVLVKRQNGDNILPEQIEQIKTSLNKIYSFYGDLKEFANNDNLKISHTGEKRVFASKAVGVYVPKMNTIAVSNKLGSGMFETIFAHETTHWVDKLQGSKTGKRHISDNYESEAGVLAFTFRANMNEKSNSKYINATNECLARAMEQHFAITYGNDDVKDKYFTEEHYVSKEVYETKILPLIDKFIQSLGYGKFDVKDEYNKFIENVLDKYGWGVSKIDDIPTNKIIDEYIKGNISVSDITNKFESKDIATRKELADFYKNQTMIDIKAEEMGLKPKLVKSKIKELYFALYPIDELPFAKGGQVDDFIESVINKYGWGNYPKKETIQPETQEQEPEQPETNYYKINENQKYEIYFDYNDYKNLDQDLKKDIKSYFLWSRYKKAWISKSKAGNNYYIKNLLGKLNLQFVGKDKRLSFAEEIERKKNRAEHRAEKYEVKAIKADQRAKDLQSEFNRLRKDWSWLTQPIIAGHSGSQAFARQRNRVFNNYNKGFEEMNKAEYYRQKKQLAEDTLNDRNLKNPTYIDNRIKDAEKSIRKISKWVEEYQNKVNNTDMSEADKNKYLEWIEDGLEKLKYNYDKLSYYQLAKENLIQENKEKGIVVFDRDNIKKLAKMLKTFISDTYGFKPSVTSSQHYITIQHRPLIPSELRVDVAKIVYPNYDFKGGDNDSIGNINPTYVTVSPNEWLKLMKLKGKDVSTEFKQGGHIGFENLSNKVAQEYLEKGYSPSKAKEIGNKTAGKVKKEKESKQYRKFGGTIHTLYKSNVRKKTADRLKRELRGTKKADYVKTVKNKKGYYDVYYVKSKNN